MKIDWESENMAWRFYLQLDWSTFYLTLIIAGVDITFHIINLRDIVYQSSEDKELFPEVAEAGQYPDKNKEALKRG